MDTPTFHTIEVDCPDCHGTCVYQGLGPPEPCRGCEGYGKIVQRSPITVHQVSDQDSANAPPEHVRSFKSCPLCDIKYGVGPCRCTPEDDERLRRMHSVTLPDRGPGFRQQIEALDMERHRQSDLQRFLDTCLVAEPGVSWTAPDGTAPDARPDPQRPFFHEVVPLLKQHLGTIMIRWNPRLGLAELRYAPDGADVRFSEPILITVDEVPALLEALRA